MITDPVAAVTLLSKLKALGVRLAIDDFGTGYSSLSYLHRFPLDTLKIDRSFTSAMGSGQKEENIISAIMPLARSLGMDVVAEGVETEEQLVFLKEVECKYAQGFYFSKPIPAEEAQKLLLNPVIRQRALPPINAEPAQIESRLAELANV